MVTFTTLYRFQDRRDPIFIMPTHEANESEPVADLTGRKLGDYLLLRKLGQGAMGQVYLASQLSLKREVALKILRDDHAANPVALKRFQAEAEAVARLAHPNIVQVYAVGEEAGLRYMALEYVEGRNLRDYLARKGIPDLGIAIRILKQVAAALLKASEVGLIHRDIKPDNILVTRKVQVKVADFGLSRYDANETKPLNLTQSGMTLGTPLYMSPEQVQGQPVDHRSDLYSLGITAYHLLAGEPPFRGATSFEVALQHVQASPPPLSDVRPDLPAELVALVHKLIAKNPNERYASAREVLRDLSKIQNGLPLDWKAPEVSLSQPMQALRINTEAKRTSEEMASLTNRSNQVGHRVAPQYTRVFWLALAMLIVTAGWFSSSLLISTNKTVIPTVGLPTARPPVPLASRREQELKAKLRDRASTPAEVFDATCALALVYLEERRFEECKQAFLSFDQERLPLQQRLLTQAIVKLGEAIVLIYLDQPQKAQELLQQLFDSRGRVNATRQLEFFIITHPEFGEALAMALNYLAESIAPNKLPPTIDYLRTPGSLLRGPRN